MPIRKKSYQAELKKMGDHEVLLTMRTRFAAAELTTTPGVQLLPPTSRGKYRIVNFMMIAIGGAAGGATSINVIGTRAGAEVQLFVALVAALTQNTLVRAGDANTTLLTAGDSFTTLDANTGVNVARVGSALSGATHIDVIVNYALELASQMSGA